MTTRRRFWDRDFDIRTRVIALISVLLIPLLMLAAWLAYNFADAERRVIETKRFDAVNNLSFIFDREIAQTIGALNGLASSPDLIQGEFKSFRNHARPVSTLPQLSSLVVFDQTGQQLFSTFLPEGAPLPQRTDLSFISRVFRGETVVSGVTLGTASNRPLITVSAPVYRDGKIQYALTCGIFLDNFQAFFAKAGLGRDWVGAVVDRDGLFVSRSINADKFAGKPARPELAAAAKAPSDMGTFENVTLEGLATSNSYRRSDLTGWTSVVAVPRTELADPQNNALFVLLVTGLTVSLFSLAFAWHMATRISEPVRRLREASVALVEGRPIPELPGRVTELIEVRAAFEHAGNKLAHLAAIVASSGDAILSVGLDGKILSWNPGAERLFGYTAEEIIGQPKSIIIPPALHDGAMKQLNRALHGERVRTETQRLRKDGILVDVSLDLAPMGDANGAIIGMSTIAHDITDKKLAEQHQRFLMRELTHRSKNLLAVINAMARQTARSAGSLAEFETRFSRRVQGMAASHDLLVSQNWTAASLRELVTRHVQIFLDNIDKRLELSGPEVYVGVEAAQTLGLALHELATNSLKYGALSRPAGKVIFDWNFEPMDCGGPGLRVTWTERGGPPVSEPDRTGFGHIVTERMVAQSLDGKVTLRYLPTGLVWVLKFPQSHLVDADVRHAPKPMADALS